MTSVVLDISGRPVDTVPYFSNSPFIAVAGGSGFIGSHVTQCLVDQGYKVVCITRGNRKEESSEIIFSNNVVYLDHDLASSALTSSLLESLQNCVALVNLVGIKMEKQQTFETAHIEVVKRIIEVIKKTQNIKKLIHVSVLCARLDADSGYHDTKFRSEELIKASGIPYTILKPSVVYGKGDDMVTSLAGVIRTSPLFPLIGNGSSLHQPIIVTDLADCIAACLNNDSTLGKSYELVGPTKVTTKEMVQIVADGMGLPTFSFAFPVSLHKIAAEVSTKLLPNPPATPTQLKMLVEGMTGDSSLIRHDLDMPKLCTTVLAPNIIQQFESQISPIAGFSLRLLSSQSHYAWLESHSSLIRKSLTLFTLALFLACVSSFLGTFVSVALCYFVLGAILIYIMKPNLRWRIEMIQPPPPSVRLYHAAIGLAFGLCLCIFIKYFLPLDLSAWGEAAKPWRTWKSFFFIFFFSIPTDEILWSASITIPLLARVACGKQDKEKDEFSFKETNPVHRNLGYSVIFGLAISYGIFLTIILKLPFVDPAGLIIATLVGLSSSILVVKTEKLVAGMVCKAFVWIVMLLWLDG